MIISEQVAEQNKTLANNINSRTLNAIRNQTTNSLDTLKVLKTINTNVVGTIKEHGILNKNLIQNQNIFLENQNTSLLNVLKDSFVTVSEQFFNTESKINLILNYFNIDPSSVNTSQINNNSHPWRLVNH